MRKAVASFLAVLTLAALTAPGTSQDTITGPAVAIDGDTLKICGRAGLRLSGTGGGIGGGSKTLSSRAFLFTVASGSNSSAGSFLAVALQFTPTSFFPAHEGKSEPDSTRNKNQWQEVAHLGSRSSLRRSALWRKRPSA